MSGNKDKQSVEISEEKNRNMEYQRDLETLLHRLHLQDKQKLSPADFLKIVPPVKQDHETSEEDLAQTFLQRLMMLDYRARYIPVRQDRAEVSHSNPIAESETVEIDDSDLDAFLDTDVDCDQSKQTHVHPMDVQMTVFHCSDSFLKQNMMTKLSQCQYALPLLVPDPVTLDVEFPLWTFRQIRKTWKTTQIKGDSNIVTMKSSPICKAETPMVSFFRLGSLSVSKSQLMNTLINERHNTFFHRNCPGSTRSRLLMDGVAEIAWYCPAGKPNDAFTDCTAFCNLHGDALVRFEKQRKILTEKSSVNVVLLPTLKKGDKRWAVFSDLVKSPKPLILDELEESSAQTKEPVEAEHPEQEYDTTKGRGPQNPQDRKDGTSVFNSPNRKTKLKIEGSDSNSEVHQSPMTGWLQTWKVLMISGHPMELMDGDAGHVPLTWISSLLEEVIKRLGDQRVFVLSVLGLQSSGKSTMLNAMFGLQFAVSAGRCTKGAFMQLIKVSEEMKRDFKFDFVLVVDTEGLRALELAGSAALNHDNELATFVVGLGNMTLINIFGENPAEMQDVLQIVVQAFMRMKKVKLSPSCVFVHQNVTDISAAEKNMEGKRRLQEKLDQMTQLAAKEEVCDAECFSDIIAFDVQKDVKYFAQLWEGSPPMAPPNPGYSESIQELKNFILSKASQSDVITLSQFKSKIHDLWEALLNENFVFSFKNTLEIKVYRNLEVQYGNWTWALRSNMLTIENLLHTKIANGKLDKVEFSYLSKEMSKTYGEIQKEMSKHFDDDRDKEMLVQWRGTFEKKIKEFHDEQVRGVKRKLDEVIQQKTACKKLDDQKTEFENKLLQKSKELARQLKDKTQDEEELKQQFDFVWRDWVRELTADTKPIEDINLEEDQSTILHELGFEWDLIDKSKKSGRYKNISVAGDYSHYVTLTKYQELCDESQQPQEREGDKREKGLFGQFVDSVSEKTIKVLRYFKGTFQHEDQQLIRSLIDNLEKQSLDTIKNKPLATRGYSSTYLQEVAKNVKEKVTEFESGRKFALKREFTVELSLYVFDRAGTWLSESHEKFKKKNDARTHLESKKDQYYNIFRSFCKGNSSAVVLGELICEKLKVSTVEAVCNQTAIALAGEMKCSFPAFSGNRLNLEKHVLKSLAEKEDFSGFIDYIHQPRKHVERFIKEEVQKYIFTSHKDKARDILKKNVEDIKQHVSRALFTATEKVKTQTGDTDMWLEEFTSFLRDDLTFDSIRPENFRDINSFDFLKEEIEKSLEPIMKEMNNLSLNKMNEFRLKPDQILIDQLCKCCWVKCPFCAAVCTNTIEDHSPDDHSVPFHRSTAVNGVHYKDTDILSVEFCTTNVASDGKFYPDSHSDKLIPFKQYRTAGPRFADWRITPDESKLTYWKWFVCRFQKQLEDHYKLKFKGEGEIPRDWRNYNEKEAIKSLDEMYKL
ncbi:LOW QUALITY PROTEIN: interferon-induced very large GTPase 1-like [Seriola dumerili]|uniref:LOW QUALITY PROTEIN: interferon-induced very large GTPase 1-like n=1 Tax=Seriola dumerili TaxID=41447 RepID=UPI000BBE333C|nr:LOW QUALITY PROTEIN: interferon-induced very large GTPase 1-like [Seriola dumerili]